MRTAPWKSLLVEIGLPPHPWQHDGGWVETLFINTLQHLGVPMPWT